MFTTLHQFIFASSMFVASALAAAAPHTVAATHTVLEVNFSGKFTVNVPITPATTMAQIKQEVADKEGPLPVEDLVLFKTEWTRDAWIIPQQTRVSLEDDKTCAHYDITASSRVFCYLNFRRRFSH